MVGSSAGGRLSTTNQPRSSSDLAAVDRPAPDMPVMMTMSGVAGPARSPVVSDIARRSPRILDAVLPATVLSGTVPLDTELAQRGHHRLGKLRPDPGGRRRDLLRRRRRYRLHRA